MKIVQLQQTALDRETRRAQEILAIFRKSLTIRDEDFAASRIAKETHDPFRVLIVTILSQNCTDVAALRAYYELERAVGVSPSSLSSARIQTIKKAIRTAGLYKQKARAIKQLSTEILESYSGNFATVINGPFAEVRERLQELPKVGPKTADVLLSIWGQPTISVDTHVDRVSKRLGFARPKAKYEEVRSNLMRVFRQEDYRFIPLYFMALGRKICKAQRPLCPTCPVTKVCPNENKTKPRIMA